jgi:hypothetical protein
MLMIGYDYHPGFQQIAFVGTETGELSERRLAHRAQAEQFYRELEQKNLAVQVVGIFRQLGAGCPDDSGSRCCVEVHGCRSRALRVVAGFTELGCKMRRACRLVPPLIRRTV